MANMLRIQREGNSLKPQ